MKLEGLIPCLYKGAEEGVVITCNDLITDRQPQIKTYTKKEMIYINHWFNVWHMAKGNSVHVI